jgi:hypothetical protein
MIVEDHDMSDRFFALGDSSRRDHEDGMRIRQCATWGAEYVADASSSNLRGGTTVKPTGSKEPR